MPVMLDLATLKQESKVALAPAALIRGFKLHLADLMPRFVIKFVGP